MIIDSHVHLTHSCPHKKLVKDSKQSGIEYNIVISDFDSVSEVLSFEEMLVEDEIMKDKFLKIVVGIDVESSLPKQLAKILSYVKSGKVCGIKMYPGYQYFYPHEKRFKVVYDFAAKYKIPVIVHTGDVYARNNLRLPMLKYAQPLHIDEAACKFPRTTFIIAHMGCPWLLDSAEVVLKNDNVYADISGIFLRNEKSNKEFAEIKLKEALLYLDSYHKIIFGSDYPLVDRKEYIQFFKKMIPEKYHDAFFTNTAKKLFKI